MLVGFRRTYGSKMKLSRINFQQVILCFSAIEFLNKWDVVLGGGGVEVDVRMEVYI